MCTIQWLVCFVCLFITDVHPSLLLRLGHVHHPKKKPCVQWSPAPCPLTPPKQPLVYVSTFFLYRVSVQHSTFKGPVARGVPVTGFLHLARFQGSSTLPRASALPAVYVSVQQLVGVGLFPPLGHREKCCYEITRRFSRGLWFPFSCEPTQ